MHDGILMAAALAASAATAPQDIDAAQRPAISAAGTALLEGRPQAALDAIDPVVKAYDAGYADEKRALYCGMNQAEALLYMALPLNGRPGAVAIGPGLCEALFIAGFALIDVRRVPEALATYRRLVALAPMHAHYLAELGQAYRLQRDWNAMYATCRTALDAAKLDPDHADRETGNAWRCMGYALIEQGRYDEAEALYRACLKLDPGDAKAKNELAYIAGQRAGK